MSRIDPVGTVRRLPADAAIVAEFNRSEFARLLGMVILRAEDGYAEVEMECAGKMNPHDVAHGGAIFALADHAFGIAANCVGIERVAVSVSIQYLVPAKGILLARAARVADNGRYSTYRVEILDGDRHVAQFEGIALRVGPDPS